MYFFLDLGAGTDTGWTDTGFPVGGGANCGGRGEVATYKLARFYQKLHEINKLLLCMGGTGRGICE